MLVTFKTSAYSDITMFGEPAVALLKLMGQSGNVPGAILAADIPKALETLHEALAKLEAEEAGTPAPATSNDPHDAFDDEQVEQPVALHSRAGPLLKLLAAAAAAKESVLWSN